MKGFVVKHGVSGKPYPRSFSDKEAVAIDAFLRHQADLNHEEHDSRQNLVRWKKYVVQGYAVVSAEMTNE